MLKKELVNPFSDKFWKMWELWKVYKKDTFKFTYKSVTSEQSALNGIVELSAGLEDVAIKIIKKSMENQWKGLHPINNQLNGKQPISQADRRKSFNDALNKRFGGG